ncbi:hypothetical protein EAG_12349 [Camponotus floridanus]|uniref:Uncharacterized protein n=1 Tax=Camponotus floridanus TaxID=104421 RepID=E2AMS9_CAMFO|nr:hypothetical protein EAG_12349 [Camponotus floridanus]
MEEDKKEKETKRRQGRPRNKDAEGGVERERSVSVSSMRSMDEYVKRKRAEGEEGGGEEEDVFKKSRMTERSPIRDEGVRSMFKELMGEVKGMRKELREQKEGLRKEIRKLKEEMQEWDVVGLVETWVGKEEWKKWKGRVPGEFAWEIQGAKKEGKRGRAKGGIWMGIRRGLEGGKGSNTEKKFCGLKDLSSPVTQKAHDKIRNNIYEASKTVARLLMKQAVQEQQRTSLEEEIENYDLGVSGDDT